MSTPIASLGGTNLPTQFSYRPYVPVKRNTVVPTAGAVVTQYAPTQIIHGDGTLGWSIAAATPLEWKVLWDQYNEATPTLYTFLGYWGESLGVYFTTLDQPTVRGRLFEMSGQFQVICVNVDYDPACGWQ